MLTSWCFHDTSCCLSKVNLGSVQLPARMWPQVCLFLFNMYLLSLDVFGGGWSRRDQVVERGKYNVMWVLEITVWQCQKYQHCADHILSQVMFILYIWWVGLMVSGSPLGDMFLSYDDLDIGAHLMVVKTSHDSLTMFYGVAGGCWWLRMRWASILAPVFTVGKPHLVVVAVQGAPLVALDLTSCILWYSVSYTVKDLHSSMLW